MSSLFLPGESDARRMISRGEVDAAVVLGRLSIPLEQAIADRGDALSLVRISDAAEMPQKPTGHSIHIRCASGTIAATGTMLREDGRRVVLAPHRQATLPQMRELLVDLTSAVRQSLAVPAAGGQP
jgi:formylmethanofuran dehydrogenase subunit B